MLTEQYDMPVVSGPFTAKDERGREVESATYQLVHKYVTMSPRRRGGRFEARKDAVKIFQGIVRGQDWFKSDGFTYEDGAVFADLMMHLLEEVLIKKGYWDKDKVWTPYEPTSAQHLTRLVTNQLKYWYWDHYRSDEKKSALNAKAYAMEKNQAELDRLAKEAIAEVDPTVSAEEVEEIWKNLPAEDKKRRRTQARSMRDSDRSEEHIAGPLKSDTALTSFTTYDTFVNDVCTKVSKTFILDICAEIFSGSDAHLYDVIVTLYNLEHDEFIGGLSKRVQRFEYLTEAGLISYYDAKGLARAEKRGTEMLRDALLEYGIENSMLRDIADNQQDQVFISDSPFPQDSEDGSYVTEYNVNSYGSLENWIHGDYTEGLH
jgi:hypothetical protein